VVRKYEPTVRTIIVAVIHIPILRRVLLEISVVRRDLCHFCQSSPRRVLGVAIRANPGQQQTRPTIGDANQSLRLAEAYLLFLLRRTLLAKGGHSSFSSDNIHGDNTDGRKHSTDDDSRRNRHHKSRNMRAGAFCG
jgi:hypothetical protein